MGLLQGLLTQKPDYVCRNGQVVLRAPSMEDFEQWRALRLSGRDFLQPWEPTWSEDEFLLSSFRRRINHYAKLVGDDLAYPFFIFSHDGSTLKGGITLSNVRRGVAQMATLGYWTGAGFAQSGVMTDALGAVVNFAGEKLDLHRLEAACLPSNTPSIKLLERARFEREGFARAYLKINGQWEDHVLWGRRLSAA
jgi:[ribosomal protein S5]-alanine N-acetyltransferase